MLNILFTFDYEIFGNGSGDIKNCLIHPATKIVSLLNNYSIKATFFVDVCLIWAIDSNEKAGAFDHWDYSPSKLIKDHLQNLINEGHDIQLHAHPQMIDSKFLDDRFLVNYDYWRISDLPLGVSNNDLHGINGILAQGKQTLEGLLQERDKEYRCTAFRAGGLCSRPEQNLLKAMRQNGLRYDFSGAYNFRMEDGIGTVDFTDVFKKAQPILAGDSYYDKSEVDPIISIPIYGAKYYYWSGILRRGWDRLIHGKSYWNWKKIHPAGCNGTTEMPGSKKVRNMNHSASRFKTITMNFYLENSAHSMTWCTKDALRKAQYGGSDVFMVGIGHPKAMGDLSQLEEYLKWLANISKSKNIKFLSVKQLMEHDFSQFLNK